MVGNHTLPNEYLSNCTDGVIYCTSQWANNVTTGAFWVLALFIFSIIIFLATLRFGGNRAFGTATFFGLLGAIWLSVLKLIPWWIGTIFIIVGVIGFVVMAISER